MAEISKFILRFVFARVFFSGYCNQRKNANSKFKLFFAFKATKSKPKDSHKYDCNSKDKAKNSVEILLAELTLFYPLAGLKPKFMRANL